MNIHLIGQCTIAVTSSCATCLNTACLHDVAESITAIPQQAKLSKDTRHSKPSSQGLDAVVKDAPHEL